jgi:hypothetical protein
VAGVALLSVDENRRESVKLAVFAEQTQAIQVRVRDIPDPHCGFSESYSGLIPVLELLQELI